MSRLVAVVVIASIASTSPQAQSIDRPTQRQRVIGLCEGLLVKEHRNVATTDHFEVVSDSSSAAAAKVLAGNFESVFHVLAGLFPMIDEAPSSGKVRAYFFNYRQQYEVIEKAFRGTTGRTAGMYVPGSDVLVFHLEQLVQQEVRHTMIHECTHAYVDRVLCASGGLFPASLNEGFAEYVAMSLVRDGQIRLGTYEEKTRYESAIMNGVHPSKASEALEAAQSAAKHHERMLSLDYLLTAANPPKNSEKELDEFYAVAWLFVDFLRHGKPEWARAPFPRFLVRVGKGDGPLVALTETYGMTAAELERGFKQYVKDFTLPVDRAVRPLPAEPN